MEEGNATGVCDDVVAEAEAARVTGAEADEGEGIKLTVVEAELLKCLRRFLLMARITAASSVSSFVEGTAMTETEVQAVADGVDVAARVMSGFSLLDNI